jgi:hypothetical protein
MVPASKRALRAVVADLPVSNFLTIRVTVSDGLGSGRDRIAQTTTETYTYDAVGNRLPPLGASPYSYSSNDM